jgi:hypothetical protein
MAFEFNPFTEDGRARRLGQPAPYSQYPSGASVNPNAVSAANPTPQTTAVGSLPNQLNIDESVAYPVNEAFLDWYTKRANAGTGFLPTPTPYLTFNQERDQTNGDYINRGFDADWSGVPDQVRDLQQLYLEPVVGRLNRSIGDENAQRQKVRDVAQPVWYQTERAVQNIDPQTGRSFTTFAPQTAYQPFFPIQSLFM